MYKQVAENRQKTFWLITLFLVVLIGVGYAASVYWESPGILFWAVLISCGMSWWSYFAGDKAILAIAGARKVKHDASLPERQIVHLVENLCIASGLPLPQVYLIPDPAPNAFAVGRDPKHASIALTTGLTEKLEKAELEGVVAHELAHIKNYDTLLATITVTLLGIIVLIADWMSRSSNLAANQGIKIGFGRRDSRDNGGANWLAIIAIIFIILAPIFARLIYLGISRQREYLADASGALLTRYPEGLANALRKLAADKNRLRFANRATAGLYIIDPFKKIGERVSEAWSTHPPLTKRIAALEKMNV